MTSTQDQQEELDRLTEAVRQIKTAMGRLSFLNIPNNRPSNNIPDTTLTHRKFGQMRIAAVENNGGNISLYSKNSMGGITSYRISEFTDPEKIAKYIAENYHKIP